MQLTDRQISALVGGKDTQLHSHSFDRSATHSFLDELQRLEKVVPITADYVASFRDDYILADSTAGAIAISIPFGKGQKEITVIRVAGTFNVTLNAAATDTINGFSSLVISNSYTPVHLKAFAGFGWVQV